MQNSGLLFIKPLDKFVHPCTKECILLYKTINSFVQKNVLFCTRLHKHPAWEIKSPERDLERLAGGLLNAGRAVISS